MLDIFLDPRNKKTLEHLAKDVPQSSIFSAPIDFFDDSLAKYFLQSNIEVLCFFPQKDEKDDRRNGTISSEKIRSIVSLSRTKLAKKRLIIFYDAEKMSAAAAAAFLKLLEEPNTHLHFLLISSFPEKILPTIVSRCQLFSFYPLSVAQSQTILKQYTLSQEKAAQVAFIANGIPGSMRRLCEDEMYFSKKVSLVQDARTLVSSKAFAVLELAQTYKDDRAKTLEMIDFAIRICRHLLEKTYTRQLLERAISLTELYEAIQQNGNIRLHIARFVL